MSNDDDNKRSKPPGKPPALPKRTLIGTGPTAQDTRRKHTASSVRPLPAVPGDPPAPGMRSGRLTQPQDDFRAEATAIADHLVEAVIDDIDAMLSEVSEVDFGGESTQISGGVNRPRSDVPRDSMPELDIVETIERAAPLKNPRPTLEKLDLPAAVQRLDGPPRRRPSVPTEPHLPSIREDSLPTPIVSETDTTEPTAAADPSLMAFNQSLASDSDADFAYAATSAPSTGQELPAVGTGWANHDTSAELPEPVFTGAAPPRARVSAAPSGEFRSENTEILDSPFEADPSVAKLTVLDGPAIGIDFFAAGLRNTIGRGANNTIVVPDLAMSRQHFEILKNPDESYTIRDLQSVNGTTLNSTKIREADLLHGDRIEAGKSTFQFVIAGAAQNASGRRRIVPAVSATLDGAGRPRNQQMAAPTAQQGPSLGKLLVYFSVGAAIIAVLIIVGVFVLMQRRQDAPVEPAGPQAAEIYLLGVDAVKQRNWDVARAQFERAGSMDPKMPGLEEQLRRIEVESKAQKALEDGRTKFEAGDHASAADFVANIPRDSVYYADGQELLRQRRKTEIEALYLKAQEALTNDERELAKTYASRILEQVPTHVGARTLLERIETAEATGEEVVLDEPDEALAVNRREPEPEGLGDGFLAIPTTPTKKKPTKKSSGDKGAKSQDDLYWDFDEGSDSSKKGGSRVPNFTEGYTLYKTKRFSQAKKFFDDASGSGGVAGDLARKTSRAVSDFEKNYNAANSAYDRKDWKAAYAKLLAAKRADSRVAGNKGYFHGELSTKLAVATANLGLADLKAGKNGKAKGRYDDARAYAPGDATVKALGKALDSEAEKLLAEATAQKTKDKSRAAELCRRVKATVPSTNPNYRRADKLLKEL